MKLIKIKSLASSVLSDSDYKKLIRYLTYQKLTEARFFIENIIDELELKINSSSDDEMSELLLEMENLNKIESEIFNLYVREDEGEQIKQPIG